MRPLFRRLSTLRHGRGFGVHSPLAYELISSVLRDRPAYYADASLKQFFPDRRHRRMARILLRLIARFEPRSVALPELFLPVVAKADSNIPLSDNPDEADMAAEFSDNRLAVRVGRIADGHGPLVLDNESDIRITVYRRGLSPTYVNTTL